MTMQSISSIRPRLQTTVQPAGLADSHTDKAAPLVFPRSLDGRAIPPAGAPRRLDGQTRSPDIRPALAIALHAAGEYRLPRASRESMIIELMGRPLHRHHGICHPGWDIRMSFPWQQDGRDPKGLETSRDHDNRWLEAVRDDKSIFHRACENALSAWLDDDVDLLDMDGALECRFDLIEPGRDMLLLTDFAGQYMGFASRSAWIDHVRSLDDDQLGHLWMSLRVIDTDLSRQHRAEIMAAEYNRIRHEMEAEWDLDIESLSF